MNKIVFIEGISGVGKTTITTLLCDKLQSMEYKADCYLEGACDNPLDPFNGTYPPKIPFKTFTETYTKCWKNFSESKLTKDFILNDGRFLRHQINDLIREYNMSDDIIANYLSNLLYIIQHLYPILFYLSSSDVGQCLVKARESRKQSVPTEEQIAFWTNRKRVDLYVLDRLSVESHILNIDDGWNAVLETMVKHITK